MNEWQRWRVEISREVFGREFLGLGFGPSHLTLPLSHTLSQANESSSLGNRHGYVMTIVRELIGYVE
jgi:hypothetical protein